MKRDIKAIIEQMTLREKAGLCSGLDFWHTKAVERLGIPSIMMADGPHGLRKQIAGADHLGVNVSTPATCFPAGAALSCSWDRKLMEKVGAALGEECQAEQVSILLGPAANIKRSPLCGRNFEYLSEDPYLTAEMAAAHIRGVQSQGVGTSLKHYAVNNQETRRLLIDAILDGRTLREIYLSGFEGAVRQSQPWTVMCSYNRVNGAYCSENKFLLTEILKDEWGFKGFVVSDWGAVNERVDGLAAGLELEMPSSGGCGDEKIVHAVRNRDLPEYILNQAVERLLNIIFRAADSQKGNAAYSKEEHHRLARKAAGECAVLLKNEGGLLPLKKQGKVAVIGGFARNARYQGGGSSHVNPTALDSAYEEIRKLAGSDVQVLYAAGYLLDEEDGMFSREPFLSASDKAEPSLMREAADIAEQSDVAVVFAGLPESYESEGFDRKHIRIPEGHRQLIEAVAAVQKNTVVVLSNGSPVEMPWLGKVGAVLEMYLGGQASGGAAADILFGEINPSGKLAETFPKKLSDTPSFLNFPGELEKVEYREGLFVGYRHYDAAEMEPLFPFGYGLSYTSFEYTGISVDKSTIKDSETVKVTVRLKNTGNRAGKETVQLYVNDPVSSVLRPVKELKGFQKVELRPGEEKAVVFPLEKRSFAFYDTEKLDWRVENGEFRILAGGSSRDLPLEASIYVESTAPLRKVFTRNTPICEILAEPEGAEVLIPLIRDVSGGEGEFPRQEGAGADAATNAGSGNCKAGCSGSEVYGTGCTGTPDTEISSTGGGADALTLMLQEMPLRSIIMFNPAAFNEDRLEELLKRLNGR